MRQVIAYRSAFIGAFLKFWFIAWAMRLRLTAMSVHQLAAKVTNGDFEPYIPKEQKEKP